MRALGLILVASAAALAATVAYAQETRQSVVFSSPDALNVRAIVDAQYASWRSFNREGSIEAALIDIDGDRQAEIAVRLKNGNDCQIGSASCRIEILRHSNGGWQKVLSSSGAELSTSPAVEGYVPAMIDGQHAYRFGNGAYRLDVPASGGKKVELAIASEEQARTLLTVFGQRANRAKLGDSDIRMRFGREDIDGDGESEIITVLSGPGACGSAIGCPVRVLKKVGNVHKVILSGFTNSDIFLLPASRDDFRSIALQDPRGGVAYAWNGQRYSIEQRD